MLTRRYPVVVPGDLSQAAGLANNGFVYVETDTFHIPHFGVLPPPINALVLRTSK